MANNQYVNKIIFGNETLIDLSQDTIQASALITGLTAHDASGAIITGTMPEKDGRDLILSFQDNGKYGIDVPYGCYSSGILTVNGIQMTVPSSGTNEFYIDFPNNSAPASADDWTRITFSVDANGNSNITDDTIPASGVSF